MDLRIKGKVALIAAGTRGLGLATAQSLAQEGVIVSVCGRDRNQLEIVQKLLGPEHRAYECDISKAEDISRWIQQTQQDLGAPTILVTNTGGPPTGVVTQLSEAQWKAGFENTILNIVRMMEHTVPFMKAAQWGRIIHITSLVAKDPNPLLAISSALRVGITAMSRLQAKELGRDGITVNCVLPGHTETDRQTHLLEVRAERNKTSVEDEKRKSSEAIPLGRMASPQEIGDVIAFLCSERASYVTWSSNCSRWWSDTRLGVKRFP